MIRAKFQCQSVRKYRASIWDQETNKSSDGFLYEYEFYPVVSRDGENAKFFASTPSGNLKLSAVADDLFVPGEYYYLDFTAAV